jgi:hypothetical protein
VLSACDFFEARTLTGARRSVFAVIEHTTRRIRVLGATAHPTGDRVTQLGAMHARTTGKHTPERAVSIVRVR